MKGFAYRRVKDDVRDAKDLADLLRMGRLPEAWIAPPAVRQLREAVRHRSKLVALRSRGEHGAPGLPLAAVLAMTDDFEAAVITGKGDREQVGQKLRAKETAEAGSGGRGAARWRVRSRQEP
ncbi:MAG TPA: transposase [Jiangellales bacterium]|nr:transposase [Jiangellales bacterium]